MNTEKQRIAIAEACGWTRQSDNSIWFNDPTNSFQAHEQDVPDYLNNLNAMHKAEKALRPILQERYYRLLREKIGSYDLAISATAAQRAEAFLRTIGKWEDGK